MCQLLLQGFINKLSSLGNSALFTKFKPLEEPENPSPLRESISSDDSAGSDDGPKNRCGPDAHLCASTTLPSKHGLTLISKLDGQSDDGNAGGPSQASTPFNALPALDGHLSSQSTTHSYFPYQSHSPRPTTSSSGFQNKSSKAVLYKAIKKRDHVFPNKGKYARGVSKPNLLIRHSGSKVRGIASHGVPVWIRRDPDERRVTRKETSRIWTGPGQKIESTVTHNKLARSTRIQSQTVTKPKKFTASTVADSDSLRDLLLELEARKVKGFESYEAIKKEQKLRDEAIRALQSVPLVSKEVEFIRQVSAPTRHEVNIFLDSRDQFKELHSLGGFLVTPNNLRSLSGTAWLNDEVINAYLYLVKNRENTNAGKTRLMVLNSMFFTNLQDKGYKSVARWSKRAGAGGHKILDLDGILIPVHKQAHWTLAYINVKSRRLEYYDSLFGNWTAVGLLREYLRCELGDKYVASEWVEYNQARSICPVQKNGFDCGVFLCKTAEVICRGGSLTYTQEDIPNIRILMQADLFKGSLDWEDVG